MWWGLCCGTYRFDSSLVPDVALHGERGLAQLFDLASHAVDRARKVRVDLGDSLGEDGDGAALAGEGEGALAPDAARACGRQSAS